MLNNKSGKMFTALLLIISLCLMSACNGSAGKEKKLNNEAGKETGEKSDKEDEDSDKKSDKASGDVSDDIQITTEMLLYTEALDTAAGSKEDKYKLATVRSGDFDHTVFAIGEVEYRDVYYQTLEIDEAKVVKWEAAEGDYVKKGDTILTYEPVFDKAAYSERVADVTQQEKEYTAGYDMRRAEIIKAEHELSKIKDDNEREIKRLEIKKLKLALNEYKEIKTNIDNTKKELEEYKSGIESGEIVANHDGYILKCEDISAEEIIGKGTMVATVSPMKDYLIRIEELPEGQIRYNSDVTVKYNADEGEESVPGKVIMSTNILTYANTQNYAYVKCNDEAAAKAPKGNVRVYFQSKALKDVLLVDAAAVKFETKGEGTDVSDVPYVYIYENGTAFKRYIEVFGSNSKEYLVLQGLDEGQQVVVSQTGSGTAFGGSR